MQTGYVAGMAITIPTASVAGMGGIILVTNPSLIPDPTCVARMVIVLPDIIQVVPITDVRGNDEFSNRKCCRTGWYNFNGQCRKD